jgi:hypothetical protein
MGSLVPLASCALLLFSLHAAALLTFLGLTMEWGSNESSVVQVRVSTEPYLSFCFPLLLASMHGRVLNVVSLEVFSLTETGVLLIITHQYNSFPKKLWNIIKTRTRVYINTRLS